jgi:6-phosphogluconate dehydrogenase
MRIGMVGLGRMGANMARRLARGGIGVVGSDQGAGARAALAGEPRVAVVGSLAELVRTLPAPRTIWLMLPAGAPSETTLEELATLLDRGDLVIDGANANYHDSQRHAQRLAGRGLEFIDVGVSGGVWGLENGYGLMFGGSAAAVERALPLMRILAPAPDRGWVHCGVAGTGHFAKMVHNGIEYGLMQAYAEGLALLEARTDLGLDVAKVAESWRHGTVIRSWLLDLTAEFLARDARLETVQPLVADSGEGRWTAIEAVELGVPTPVMSLALMMRFASQGKGDYAGRLLASMRHSFGGHAIFGAADEASDAAPAPVVGGRGDPVQAPPAPPRNA